MRCLTCDYDLRALGEHRCPECGRAFNPADEQTFRSGREAWPLARVASAYAATLGSVPWLAVAFVYATWAAARLVSSG